MVVKLEKINGHWSDIPLYASLSHGIDKPKEPKELLTKLYNWGHMEPFEFVSFVWKLKIPIFLERQLLRHRHSSRVEMSLRYVTLEEDAVQVFYPEGLTEPQRRVLDNGYLSAIEAYTKLIKGGVPAEKARAALPLGLITTMYVSFNARSFDNFLRLRLDSHAQPEMQELAGRMLDKLAIHEASYPLYELFNARYRKEEL